MYVFILIIVLNLGSFLSAQEGFFCVPVADLVKAPFEGTYEDVRRAYSSLTVAPEQGKQSCLRIHQGIFNESVTILAYKNDQVQVALKNCFYRSTMNLYDQRVEGWTLKDWIITYDEIDNKALHKSTFPPVYKEYPNCENAVVALTFPWLDPITGLTYSVGTRFCLLQEQSMPDYFCVVLYDAKKECSVTSYIPGSCALYSANLSGVERRKQFVQLLYAWCSQESIPYVWGGTSFTQRDAFNVALKTIDNRLLAWVADFNQPQPLCGFDCSSLILRAAQICGLAYFCCNSTTIANALPLANGQHIQEGDILWTPGHVFIVASLENNEIIEAQGYARGYGRVHCMPLKRRFQDIETWDDLITCCQMNIPLKSLDSQGRCAAYVPIIKIYRLPC